MLPGAARWADKGGWRRRASLAALAIAAIALGPGCHNDLDAFYPLDAGLAWQYRVSIMQGNGGLSGTAHVANLPAEKILGRKGIPQRSEVFGKTVVRYLSASGGGVVEFAQQAEAAPVVANSADYVLRTPITPGTNWPSVWESAREGRVSFPTVKTIAGTRETVMVPAGTFAECLRVKVAGRAEVTLPGGPATIEVTGEEWYARDVGLIKGTFRETVNQGEATIELAMNLESFYEPR